MKYRRELVAWFILFSALVSGLKGSTRLAIVEPESVGLDSNHLRHIDGIISDGIEKKLIPGCVLAFGRHGKLAFLKAYGNRQVEPEGGIAKCRCRLFSESSFPFAFDQLLKQRKGRRRTRR